MTHQNPQDINLNSDTYWTEILVFNQKLANFRTAIQQDLENIKITMDEGLSPYTYVEWPKKGSGGVIWGHRFMIEIPFPFSYETLSTDPEFECQSMGVLLACVEEHHPFFQATNILPFDSGWVGIDDQAVLMVQTRINFDRALVRFLKGVTHCLVCFSVYSGRSQDKLLPFR